jgi:hypothetical protein
MSDWKTLFQSGDFRNYRRRQAEVIGRLISHNVRQATSGEAKGLGELKGQLDVIRDLLCLPMSLTQDEGLLANLQLQLEEDIAHITTYLMREALREE